MLIGKIIAIAQRRRINFHRKRGEEKKAYLEGSYGVLPLPLTHPFTLKTNLPKKSRASGVFLSLSLALLDFPALKALQAPSAERWISSALLSRAMPAALPSAPPCSTGARGWGHLWLAGSWAHL